MAQKDNKPVSTAMPFVGTLNDKSVAIPAFYFDEENKLCAELAETPAIQTRKERTRHYLRKLPVRFLEREKLMLYVIFTTNHKRPIDATNVLDLIQNAGNKIIWNDDSQFLEVHCRRYVNDTLKPEMQHTVIYIAKISTLLVDQISHRREIYEAISNHYRDNYNLTKSLEGHFNEEELRRFYQKGFWQDDRFLQIPVLAANYQEWFIRQS